MNKQIENQQISKRFVNLREWANVLGVGIATARKAARVIGAEKRVGSRCIYDLQVLDDYFEKADAIEISGTK